MLSFVDESLNLLVELLLVEIESINLVDDERAHQNDDGMKPLLLGFEHDFQIKESGQRA